MTPLATFHPELAALLAQSAAIGARRQAAEARRAELTRLLEADDAAAQQSRIDAVLAGDVGNPAAELAEIESTLRLLRQARAGLGERIARARKSASRAVANELRPEHRAAAQMIAEAIGQLRAAVAAEAECRRRLRELDADPGVLPSFAADLRQLADLERRARAYAAPPAEADAA